MEPKPRDPIMGGTQLGIFLSQIVHEGLKGPRNPESTMGSSDFLVMDEGDLQRIALIFQSTCDGAPV